MKVMDVMSTEAVTVGPTTSLKDVARLLVTHGISGVPVVDEGAVLGREGPPTRAFLDRHAL
jgi:CBS domain-containing protein